MGRHGERGHAALWVIGAIALSSAVGVGVYLVIRDQRAAAVDDDEVAREEPAPAPRPAVAPRPAPEPPIAPVEVPSTTPPVTSEDAERTAVDPTSGTFGTPGIEGALDKDVVVQTVTGSEERLGTCGDDKTGVVRVTMLVNRRGGITTISATGVDETTDRCVENALRQLRFGKTTDGNSAKVVFPLGFWSARAREAAAACDEVSCVIDNYEPACCAKFKRPATAAASDPAQPSRDEIARGFRSISAEVQRCAKANEYAGTLKIRARFTPSGTVAVATVNDAPEAVASCVARAAKKIKLGAWRDGVAVSFPYNVQ